MNRRFLAILPALAFAAPLYLVGQQAQSDSRGMYYTAERKKETLPAVVPVANTNAQSKAKAAAPATTAPVNAVVNLGLRYNVLLNENGKPGRAVDPARNFKVDECFHLQITANRAGYLYVLAKQSSGDWIPLLPTPDMPKESNVLNGDQTVIVPEKYCFEIHDPPGTETIWVMLSRDPSEIDALDKAARGVSAPTPAKGKSDQSLLMARVNVEVNRLSGLPGTRDIQFRKIAAPLQAGEPANSVYVVNSSPRPSSHVITQIEISHRR